MAFRVEPADVLVALMGAPHSSDLVTSAVRLMQSLVDCGGQVQAWACGYATTLTQASLQEAKPRNVVDWSRDYPSSATLVRELLGAAEGRLAWYSCRFCAEERGAADQIPQVRVRPPFKFGEHVALAKKTVFLGVI
ncbi:MAG TPA: hypothetical protein VGM75_27390 [Pseudonocardiaceae bacterium]|jgi:hypothetical protein